MWMKVEQDKENSTDKVKQSGLLRCPMCKGRGYFEPTQVSTQKTGEPGQGELEKDNYLKLPQLAAKATNKQCQKPRTKYSLPSINNVKNLPENRCVEWTTTTTAAAASSNESPRHVVPTGKDVRDKPGNGEEAGNGKSSNPGMKSLASHRMSAASDTDSVCEGPLMPSPRTPRNPAETLKVSLSKLKANNWTDAVAALKDVVQLSRYQPEILEPSMAIVYRRLIHLLKSFRSVVARTACQASNELFATMSNTQRPEFDEVVGLLLQKTADTNKVIRQDANEALDTMVINVPATHSVRAITNKGISHKSPLVRATAARLLVCVAGVVGIDALYGGNKETRGRIVSAAAGFMQDGNQEVRNFGRRLMKMLMKHDDFEEVLQTDVSEVMLKRIEKTLITMKYKS